MGEAVQNKKKNQNEKNGDGGGGGGGGGKKKEDNPFTVVLKVDMHCEGCANKIIKCVKGFEGVQSVKAEFEGNKLMVIGEKIDASKLREKLSNKTKKKVDLISPQPKKEKDSKPKENNDGGDNDGDQTFTSNNKSDKKTEENKNKPKEPPVTTAVLKVSLHCQGCIEKIQRVTSKFKGVQEMSVDKHKDLVTVKGTMDVKALSGTLKERLNRSVEIVPTKNNNNNNNPNKNNSDKNKNKNDTPAEDIDKNNTENGSNGNGGGKKKKCVNGNGNGGRGEDKEENVMDGMMEGNKMEYMGGIGYEYGHWVGVGIGYGYGYDASGVAGENLHAPQMFSDENPNACSIM
ncbi:heavy metal-associated isoprenylated plant protein 3-like [Cucurbita maxima]|uniref:Heavy metal-associated isoprenylated plant protein 3-like n=1 Tax=Cucurbita maxima TaxID=3661 RepID=A0A6J1KI18_CUCMA|nr:heavy metal-associated isoprenylated plant protein 3-like [Cucurbita maxima]